MNLRLSQEQIDDLNAIPFRDYVGEALAREIVPPIRLPGDFGRGPDGRPHGRLHVALDLAIVVLSVVDLYLLAALFLAR